MTHEEDHSWAKDRIATYLSGELTAEERDRLDAHLDTCGACAQEVQEAANEELKLEEVIDSDPPPTSWQPVDPVFVRAVRAGIPSVVVSRPEFEGSGLSERWLRAADLRVRIPIREGIDSLNAAAAAAVAFYALTAPALGR